MNNVNAKTLLKIGMVIGVMLLAGSALAYVGSDACQACHSSKYDKWVDSGHPYKLTKIEGVAPIADFPSFSEFPNDPVDPPVGLGWSDISYTIGGFGWKMRWIDNQGYIVTSGAGDLVQYNFENDTWVTYHVGEEQGTKPYDCGRCHTTGWVADDDWDTDGDLSDNQDGLPGMLGTFFAGGIHCEECHGEADQHVVSPIDIDMIVDSSSASCGRCHTRDSLNRIAASGGFIKHHEQYDEWLHSPHGGNGSPGCNTCHDPHASVKFDDVAMGTGTLTTCESCHPIQAETIFHNGLPDCIDCHMAKASKSAVAVNSYVGDIRTHIFAINTDPVGKTEGFFTEDGSLVQTDVDGQAKMTLDFACYSCHKDEAGVGGPYSMKTLAQLSEAAFNIHGTSVAAVLQTYEAVSVAGGVDVNWRLSGEEDLMDFSLLRGQGDGIMTPVTAAVLTVDGNRFSFHDPTAEVGADYTYQVFLNTGAGPSLFFETNITIPAMAFALYPNQPNPFNPSTKIKFSLNEATSVSLQILDASGRLVRTLLSENLPAGQYERLWNGKDNYGHRVASGVYFSSLVSPTEVAQQKMLLVK